MANSRTAGYEHTMARQTSVPWTDPVDALVRRTMRALARRDKIPPAIRFRQMVVMGLIDEQGRLNHSGAPKTTLGELERTMRNRRRKANAITGTK